MKLMSLVFVSVLFLFKETFCELTWVDGMLWVSGKESTAGMLFAKVGTVVCALWYQGTSVLKLKDLHLLRNCLKYLSLRFSAVSFMLTASVLQPSSRSEAGWSKQTSIFPRGLFFCFFFLI